MLMSPGRGREIVALTEVGLGVGRPDLLVLAVSRRGLEKRALEGLRLRTLTDAEILAASEEAVRSRHSQSHERATLKHLTTLGWSATGDARRTAPRLVHDSLLVEAKVSDWRAGLGQLARARWSAHRAALAVPTIAAHRVPRVTLDRNSIGVITVEPETGDTAWRRKSRSRRITRAADLWLTELAIRALDST